MTIVLILGFFMSLFLLVLLAGKKNKPQADKILIAMIAVYALTIGGPFIEIYNRNNDFPYPHLMNNAWLFLLLHGPLLWLYVNTLTVKDFRIRPVHLLHLLPFLLFLTLHASGFLFLPAAEKITLIKDESFTTTAFFKIRGGCIGIFTIGYNIWALNLLRKHRKNIENQFSNLEHINLTWLRTLVIASLIVFTVNVLLFNINNYLHFAGYFQLAQIAYSFSTLYVLYIGYFGIGQGNIFAGYQDHTVDEAPSTHLQPATVDEDDSGFTEIRYRLTGLMEREQPYLDPEITLAGLSLLMQMKSELLSEVLNGSLNQNFFDFINRYRIEDFKIRCLNKENRHLSIMGIAYECGFNSKAAFYRAFNKFEGISPTAYISKVSE